MNYIFLLRTWVKTISNEDFLYYENEVKKIMDEERKRRGIV